VFQIKNEISVFSVLSVVKVFSASLRLCGKMTLESGNHELRNSPTKLSCFHVFQIRSAFICVHLRMKELSVLSVSLW